MEIKAKSQIFNLLFLQNFKNSISGRLSLNKSRREKEGNQVLVRKRGARIPANGLNLYLGNLAVNSNIVVIMYVAQILHIIPSDIFAHFSICLGISVPHFKQASPMLHLLIAMNYKPNTDFVALPRRFISYNNLISICDVWKF